MTRDRCRCRSRSRSFPILLHPDADLDRSCFPVDQHLLDRTGLPEAFCEHDPGEAADRAGGGEAVTRGFVLCRLAAVDQAEVLERKDDLTAGLRDGCLRGELKEVLVHLADRLEELGPGRGEGERALPLHHREEGDAGGDREDTLMAAVGLEGQVLDEAVREVAAGDRVVLHDGGREGAVVRDREEVGRSRDAEVGKDPRERVRVRDGHEGGRLLADPLLPAEGEEEEAGDEAGKRHEDEGRARQVAAVGQEEDREDQDRDPDENEGGPRDGAKARAHAAPP